jgi:hypothetical protein
MSRPGNKNSRGRQPTLATARPLKTKDIADDTYQEPSNRRNRGSKKLNFAQRAKTGRKAASPVSSESSDDFEGDDASDEQSESEESDDEDDLPIAQAPSRQFLNGGTGRQSFYEKLPRAVSVESMFGDNLLVEDQADDLQTLDDMRKFEETLFANASDDELYGAVDDISESDEEAVVQHEEQQLLAELSEDELEEVDLLNQIDGMSAYGFGDESDVAPYAASSHGSESASEMMPTRHVRFDMEHAHAFPSSLAESPTFSRALLPSAMPDDRHLLGTDVPVKPEEDLESRADSYDCMYRIFHKRLKLTPPQLMSLMMICRPRLCLPKMTRKSHRSQLLQRRRRAAKSKVLHAASSMTKEPRPPACWTRLARSS